MCERDHNTKGQARFRRRLQDITAVGARPLGGQPVGLSHYACKKEVIERSPPSIDATLNVCGFRTGGHGNKTVFVALIVSSATLLTDEPLLLGEVFRHRQVTFQVRKRFRGPRLEVRIYRPPKRSA